MEEWRRLPAGRIRKSFAVARPAETLACEQVLILEGKKIEIQDLSFRFQIIQEEDEQSPFATTFGALLR
jgi:hypothetical protein